MNAGMWLCVKAAKADVLRDSVIVCATISVCGSNDLTSLADCFDTVVVDEASQVATSAYNPISLYWYFVTLVVNARSH